MADIDLHVHGAIDHLGLQEPRDKNGDIGNGIDRFFRHVVMKRSRRGGPDNTRVWDMASPLWWVEAGASNDDERAARSLPPPILSVHGTHDSLVSVEDARRFSRALGELRESRGKLRVPDVFVEVPHAIHAFNMVHWPALHWPTLRSFS